MVKSTMTETVPSSGWGGTAAAMAQNEQTMEEHSTLEQHHQEGSITRRDASCGRYDQRRRRSTPKTPTWTYVGSWVEGLSKVWQRRADKATICENA